MKASFRPGGTRRQHAWIYLILPTLALLVIFFVAPLFSLFWSSIHVYVPGEGLKDVFTIAHYAKFVGDSFYLSVMFETLALGVGVTLATLILGYPLAYFVARTESRRRGLYLGLIIFPLFLNIVVRSFAWIVLLANRGLINDSLIQLGLVERPLRLLYNYFGVVVGMTHVFLPFMVLAVATTIQNINRDLEDAARSLGANRFQTFLRVTLPLSLPGVVAGSLLVFLQGITAFVTPRLLGGVTVKVISNLIYQEFMVTANWSFGAAMGFILLFATLILIVGYFRVFKMSAARA
ncbi:MAG: ABC transporter permease [Thermodesulfobacteriota bacterium]